MTQSIIPSEVYNSVCKAVGCFAIVESEIRILVGKFGTYSIVPKTME
jgi:hypothetical protein